MPTTTLNKSAGVVLLAHTVQASAVITVGPAVDVSSKIGPVTAFVKVGRSVAAALTNNLRFRLEASAKAAGNDEWVPLYEWTSANGLTAATATTLNGATAAGNASSVVASSAGLTPGDTLYFRETGVPANSEWSRLAAQAGTTSTFDDPQTRSHTNGIAITDLAELFAIQIDVTAQVRLRLVVDSASAASGQVVDVIAWLVSADSTLTA